MTPSERSNHSSSICSYSISWLRRKAWQVWVGWAKHGNDLFLANSSSLWEFPGSAWPPTNEHCCWPSRTHSFSLVSPSENAAWAKWKNILGLICDGLPWKIGLGKLKSDSCSLWCQWAGKNMGLISAWLAITPVGVGWPNGKCSTATFSQKHYWWANGDHSFTLHSKPGWKITWEDIAEVPRQITLYPW